MRRLQTISIDAAISEYEQYLIVNQRAQNTVRNRVYFLRTFAKIVGAKPVRQITSADVTKAAADWARGDGIHTSNAASTVNLKRTHLQCFFDWCEARDYLESAARVIYGVARVKEHKRKRLYLGKEECTSFLNGIEHPRDRVLCALAMFTGLRVSDITALRVGSVDLANESISTEVLKTGEYDEDLPMLEELAAELQQWLRWYAHEQGGPLHETFYLVPAKGRPCMKAVRSAKIRTTSVPNFSKLDPTRPMTRASRKMSELLKFAGFEGEYEGMHTLRRSVARLVFDDLCQPGGEARDQALLVVQHLLHHASPEMTARYIGADYGRELRNKVLRGRKLFGASSASTVTSIRRAK